MAIPRRAAGRDRSVGDSPTVSAVLVAKDPDIDVLARTLSSLADQDYPIKEVIIVDGSEQPLEADVEGIQTRVIPAEPKGQGHARRVGLSEATGDYIVEMDEDTIFRNRDYISSAIQRLEATNASAVGGRWEPIDGNAAGELVAALDWVNPHRVRTHNLVYPRQLCTDRSGEVCYPMDGRGEDLTVRDRLQQFGPIVRMNDQVVGRDLPTTRQSVGGRTLGASIAAGIVTGLATSAAERGLRRYGDTAWDWFRGE